MLFSVVIPAYNAENFIKRSIISVLNQTYTDFEVIVVNDGSKDNTLSEVKKISDSRLVIVDKPNEGVSVARNTGISIAKGEYICFLDADDEFLDMHLSTLSKAISEFSDKEFFSTRFCVSKIHDSSDVTTPDVSGLTQFYKNPVKELFCNPELVWTGCVCIKKSAFDKYGMFEPGVRLREDTDMWRRVYVRTGLVVLDVVTVKRNRDGSAATRSYTRIFEADPLLRMDEFLNDADISDDVKESLRTEHEFVKLQVVRSHILNGDKHTAAGLLKEIDKSRIPFLRMFITKICILIPTPVIRFVIDYKNRGLYE